MQRLIAGAVALTLAGSVGIVPNVAWAGPAKRAEKAQKDKEAKLAEAKQLFEKGKSNFELSDFKGAIEVWTRAYELVPEDSPGVKNAMVYNIASAQEKAYEIDKDVSHLRQAALLLGRYVKTYKSMYKKTPETKAEVKKAEDRIAALEQRVAAIERGEEDKADKAKDEIVFNTGHNPPPNPELLLKNRRLAAEHKKTDGMLIAAYVVGAVGLLALIGAAGSFGVGATADDTQNSRRTSGRTGGFIALGVGLAAVGTAATLMGVAFSKRAKLRRGELGVAPALSPRSAGAAITVRF